MRNLSTSIAFAILLSLAVVTQADFVTTYSENFDDSFSGGNMNPSVQGFRVDDTQEQVGWAGSPGYYTATEVEPWTTVGPITDFTGGGDGALLLGHATNHPTTTSTLKTMGIGTYSWDFEWEDFHSGTPIGGTTLHEVGTPVSPGEKRLGMVLMSDKSGSDHGGDTFFPERGVLITFGQTGPGGGLLVEGKNAGSHFTNDLLYTYSPCPGCLTHSGAENRPWIQLANAENHVDGIRITAQAKIVEDSPGVYLLDLFYGKTDDPDTAANEFNDSVVREISDLDISSYVSDVEGGVGAPNGYWNMAVGDAGWIKLDNLAFTGSDPPVGEGLPGDYNNNDVVDAADFTIYQDNLGGNSSVLNDNGSGAATVVQADYQLWKDNFGNTSSAASGSAIPEPGCLILLAIALTAVSSLRRVPANR